MIKKIDKDYEDILNTSFSISWYRSLRRNPFIVLFASIQVLCALRLCHEVKLNALHVLLKMMELVVLTNGPLVALYRRSHQTTLRC